MIIYDRSKDGTTNLYLYRSSLSDHIVIDTTYLGTPLILPSRRGEPLLIYIYLLNHCGLSTLGHLSQTFYFEMLQDHSIQTEFYKLA